MIKQLIKHEFKASYRIFLMMYIGVLLISILTYGSFSLENYTMQTISTLAISFGSMAVMVIYILTIFNSYERTMYGDEAYLTHTLPVKTRYILLSKSLMAAFWGVLTVIVCGVCAVAMMFLLMLQMSSSGEITASIAYFFDIVGVGNCFVIAFMIILSFIQFLIMIYFASAVSRLPGIRRFNTLVAMLVFFFASYIQGKLYSFIANLIGNSGALNGTAVTDGEALGHILSAFAPFHIIFILVFMAIYFFGASYILEKKLHIR